MLRCSNDDCNSTNFRREVNGYEYFTEIEYLDEEGGISDWGDRDYGDSEVTDRGYIVCDACGARAEEYTPETKSKKSKKAKMNWKDKIE